MLQNLKYIKYYVVLILACFCFYAYGAISGTRIFGDDNLNKDGQPVNSTGGHYYGGHGYYFHK